MAKVVDKETIYTFHVIPYSESMNGFLDWQMRFNKIVTAFPGFISLEITFSNKNREEWIIRERFTNIETLKNWQQSNECLTLEHELQQYATAENIQKVASKSNEIDAGITEVIVTEVNPGKEEEFRNWAAKIHQAEAKFPGFRGAYVQSPISKESRKWITLLQFDTIDHLNDWLSSSERKEVLQESRSFITSFEEHRVVAPFAGWFSSVSKNEESPSAWKQAMTVLLVLYPIVMLETMFLNPLLQHIDLAPRIFIGNTISVALLTWVMMPLAIWFLSWWLVPTKHKKLISLIGVPVILLLYFLEILIFSVLIFESAA